MLNGSECGHELQRKANRAGGRFWQWLVAGKILKAALPPALDHGMSQCMNYCC